MGSVIVSGVVSRRWIVSAQFRHRLLKDRLMLSAGRRPVRIGPVTLLAPLELRHRVVERGLVAAAGGLPRLILPWCLPPVSVGTAVSDFRHRFQSRPVALGTRLLRYRRLRAWRMLGCRRRWEALLAVCVHGRQTLVCSVGLLRGLDLLKLLLRRLELLDLLHAPLLRRHGLLELLNAPLRGLGFLQPLLRVLGLLELPRVFRRPAVVARPAISGSVGPTRIGWCYDEFADRAQPTLLFHHGMPGDGNTPGTEQYGCTREAQPCPKDMLATALTHDNAPGPTPSPHRPVL